MTAAHADRRGRRRPRRTRGRLSPARRRPRRGGRRGLGRAGRSRRHRRTRRVPLRHRSDGPHDARPDRRLSRRGRRGDVRRAHPAPGRSDVPGVLPGRQRNPCPPRPRGDGARDRRAVRTARRGGVRSVLRLAGRALRGRDGQLHRPQLRLAARPRPAARPGADAGAPRGLPAPQHERRTPLRRRPPAPPLHLPVDVRRAGPVRGPRRVRRDHLHGHGARGGGRRRWDARRAAGARRRGGGRRRDVPLRHAGRADPVARRRHRPGRRRRARRRRADRYRRRGGQPRPAGGVRHPAARTARTACGAPREVLAVRRRLARRRARRPAARRRPPQHPLRPRLGRIVPRADRRRHADVRPVDARDGADARRRLARPARPAHGLRPRAGTQPRRPDRLGGRALGRARAARRAGGRRRVRGRRRGRGLRRSVGLAAPRHGQGARRSRSPTGSSRVVRSGPATSSDALRAWCSSAPERCPASACRWCSSPVAWPPSASPNCVGGDDRNRPPPGRCR